MPIRITSKKDGFRRCGVAHSSTPTEYPDGRFSKEEIETLLAEPMLVVEVLPSPEEGRKGKKEKE